MCIEGMMGRTTILIKKENIKQTKTYSHAQNPPTILRRRFHPAHHMPDFLGSYLFLHSWSFQEHRTN